MSHLIAPVSVVVPCYNCAGTLGRAVDSIAAQTAKPEEVILVNDASDDRTQEVIDELIQRYGAHWIRAIKLRDNAGPASARNAGWDVAAQPYLAFLDADDSWHVSKIELQWRFMTAHPEIDVCGHGFAEVRKSPAGTTVSVIGKYRIVPPWRFLLANPFATRTVMLKNQGEYRFKPGKRYAEDYLLWLQMSLDGRKAATFSSALAYVYKPPYGAAGLSADLWMGERGELEVYRLLVSEGRLNMAIGALLSAYSLLKFIRRLVILTWERTRLRLKEVE